MAKVITAGGVGGKSTNGGSRGIMDEHIVADDYSFQEIPLSTTTDMKKNNNLPNSNQVQMNGITNNNNNNAPVVGSTFPAAPYTDNPTGTLLPSSSNTDFISGGGNNSTTAPLKSNNQNKNNQHQGDNSGSHHNNDDQHNHNNASTTEIVWLVICFVGIMASFVAYGLLLEYTTSGGRKLHELSFLFVTSALYTVTAAAGRYVRDETPTTIPPARFAILGLTSMGSTFCSVRSLRYVIYPIQVLAKSCKPVPVMLMGALMGKVRCKLLFYCIV